MQILHKKHFLFLLTLSLLSSCTSLKTKYSRDLVNKSVRGSQLFNNHFTGFVLYDPSEDKYLYELNADKYFTPASNTKLFTYYTGLKILKDSIPAFKYYESGDSLVIYGTGDPTFLHPNFKSQKAFDFLNNSNKNIYLSTGNFVDAPFGSGWAWDDYEYYFQGERTGFPIYGNVIQFVKDSLGAGFHVQPSFFEDYTEVLNAKKQQVANNRLLDYNIFNHYPDTTRSNRKNRIPFKTSDELLVKLLTDTLHKEVLMIDYKARNTKTIYSRPAREIYVRMLKASDNLVAEQIHYLCASQFGDTLQSARVRNYMLKKHLSDLPSKPVWRDGSGLSRYNLFTPRTLVLLLEKIKLELPEKEILATLPIGGVDGSLKNWYAAEEGAYPFVFAKTGTLSNNHSLSGFIRTKSGKLLTFSFMNNNYTSGSRAVKIEMDKVLRLIRDRY